MSGLFLSYFIVKVKKTKKKHSWMFTAKQMLDECFKEYFIVNDKRTINWSSDNYKRTIY